MQGIALFMHEFRVIGIELNMYSNYLEQEAMRERNGHNHEYQEKAVLKLKGQTQFLIYIRN